MTLSNALAYVLLHGHRVTLSKLPTLAPFLTLGQPAAPHARRPPPHLPLPPSAAFLARYRPLQ